MSAGTELCANWLCLDSLAPDHSALFLEEIIAKLVILDIFLCVATATMPFFTCNRTNDLVCFLEIIDRSKSYTSLIRGLQTEFAVTSYQKVVHKELSGLARSITEKNVARPAPFECIPPLHPVLPTTTTTILPSPFWSPCQDVLPPPPLHSPIA